MKQSRASRSSSLSCIWGTGNPTGAVAMITANTNNLYGHQLDNRKWREQFVQLPRFVLKHKLTVLWTKPPDFRRVFVYFWHHVDRLGKLPSKEQQLSRTQHFILKAHAAIFVLHIQYGPRGTPLTPMIQRQNCLLSTISVKAGKGVFHMIPGHVLDKNTANLYTFSSFLFQWKYVHMVPCTVVFVGPACFVCNAYPSLRADDN